MYGNDRPHLPKFGLETTLGMSSPLLKDLQSGGPWHPEADPYEQSAPQDHPSLLMKPLVFKSPEESGLGRQDGRECSFFVRLKR